MYMHKAKLNRKKHKPKSEKVTEEKTKVGKETVWSRYIY
jgi:hypothetical protein